MPAGLFPCHGNPGLILTLLTGLLCCLPACERQTPEFSTGDILTVVSDKPFTEVVEDLEFAITERNYRVVNRLEIGRAIRERGYEKFPLNTVILYCNLEFARGMLEFEPHYLHHCPARVSARQDRDKVIITAHLFPESGYNSDLDRIIKKTNTHIAEIVDYASREWFEVNEP